ncbi:hypothetical protein H9P43_004927 [Blastocladiella emersonii ATCC 22665]|nr:hypothetical protein H9P43_004927 [Blastocladiella emersonii ATCC 22665]
MVAAPAAPPSSSPSPPGSVRSGTGRRRRFPWARHVSSFLHKVLFRRRSSARTSPRLLPSAAAAAAAPSPSPKGTETGTVVRETDKVSAGAEPSPPPPPLTPSQPANDQRDVPPLALHSPHPHTAADERDAPTTHHSLQPLRIDPLLPLPATAGPAPTSIADLFAANSATLALAADVLLPSPRSETSSIRLLASVEFPPKPLERAASSTSTRSTRRRTSSTTSDPNPDTQSQKPLKGILKPPRTRQPSFTVHIITATDPSPSLDLTTTMSRSPSRDRDRDYTNGFHAPRPILKSGRSFDRSSSHLRWDEETIRLHDAERGTRMKIDEPKTPYVHHDTSMEDLDALGGVPPLELAEAMDLGSADLVPSAIAGGNRVPSSADSDGGWSDDGHDAARGRRGSAGASGGDSSESEDDENDPEAADRKRKFAMMRAQHYNMKEALARAKWDAEHEDDEDDEEEETDESQDSEFENEDDAEMTDDDGGETRPRRRRPKVPPIPPLPGAASATR